MKFLPAVFAVIVFVCYGFFYPEWFNYHEQYQLFLFGGEYLVEKMKVASGLAGYLSEFLVQFYFFPLLGAALWSGLMVLIGFLIWSLAKIFAADKSHFMLSLLPVVLLTLYCGDQNVMMSFPTALALSLSFTLLYDKISDKKRVYLQFVFIPIAYWLIGYGAFVYLALTIAVDIKKYGYTFLPILYVFEIVSVIFAVGYTVMKQYPFIDIVCGVNFYRDRLTIPFMQHIITLSVVITPPLISLIKKAGKVVTIVEAAVISLILPLMMTKTYDKITYSLLKIDYLVRFQEWDDVIKFCEKNPPTNAMGCTGLNLALAMTGQLGERMFEFPQCGQEGLISRFERNMVSCGITAEACYYLGLINSVLRYNYDSQAAIVNCNMSGRFTRRIAEVYMLNGNYELAQKYIDILKKTVFYAPWAKKAEACCQRPETITQNKRWARILRYRLPENELFSVSDMDVMLMNLYKHCPENKMALQYSLACDLLEGKMRQFVDAMSQTQSNQRIPKSYQEALAWIYLQQKGTLENLPDFISPEVKNALTEFDRLYMINRKNPLLKQGSLGKTYWRYMVGE